MPLADFVVTRRVGIRVSCIVCCVRGYRTRRASPGKYIRWNHVLAGYGIQVCTVVQSPGKSDMKLEMRGLVGDAE